MLVITSDGNHNINHNIIINNSCNCVRDNSLRTQSLVMQIMAREKGDDRCLGDYCWYLKDRADANRARLQKDRRGRVCLGDDNATIIITQALVYCRGPARRRLCVSLRGSQDSSRNTHTSTRY